MHSQREEEEEGQGLDREERSPHTEIGESGVTLPKPLREREKRILPYQICKSRQFHRITK